MSLASSALVTSPNPIPLGQGLPSIPSPGISDLSKTPPTIKQEQEDEDSLGDGDEDSLGDEDDLINDSHHQPTIGLIIKPTIENLLSSSASASASEDGSPIGGGGVEEGGGASQEEEEESEESVSEFEEDFLHQSNNGTNNHAHNLYFNSSTTTPIVSSPRGGGGVGGVRGVATYNSPKYLDSSHSHPFQRKKREAFTLQQKLQVLAFLESHSVNATSRFFKVDPKSIRLWRSQKIKIEQTVQEELQSLEQQGELEGVTPRKRISGAGRKKRNKPVIIEIEENPNKRHRRTIKLSDKVEIIRLIEHGQTQSDVARSLGISQSTVQTIWSNKGDILERNSSPRKKRKNLHWKKYSSIDSSLFNWVRQCRDSGVVLDTKMLHDKAVEYAEYYKQIEFKGQATRWIDVFKRRHSLSELDRQDRLQLSGTTTTSGHGAPTTTSSTHSLLGVGVGIGLEQHTLGQLTNSSINNHNHTHSLLQSSSSSLLPHSLHQQNNHLDFVPDFDLSSLPGLMAGLYPPDPLSSQTNGPGPPPPTSSFQLPSFNSHLPTIPVPGGPVTTCDAMKYVELIRSWISSSSFGDTEAVLTNHLNAIENAVLKRRMTEMTTASTGTTTDGSSYKSELSSYKQEMRR